MYEVIDETGKIAFLVKREYAIEPMFHIYDSKGRPAGIIKKKLASFPLTYEIYVEGKYVGSIKKQFALLKPVFDIDYKGWHIEGNTMEFEYGIFNYTGKIIASVTKKLFQVMDTYVISVANPEDALHALMLVVAIDDDKDMRDDD
jgi:uncharacterized protein YxjI